MSKAVDIVGAIGLAAIGYGLYCLQPALVFIFAGVVLLGIARALAHSEKPAEPGNGN